MLYTDEFSYARRTMYPDDSPILLSIPHCDVIEAASNILLFILMYRFFRTVMRKRLPRNKPVRKNEEILPTKPNIICPETVINIECIDDEETLTFSKTTPKNINLPTPYKDLVTSTNDAFGTLSGNFEDKIPSGKDTTVKVTNANTTDLNRNLNSLDNSFAMSDSFDRLVNFDDFSETSLVGDSFLESNESSNLSIMTDSADEYSSESTDEYDDESSATSNGSEESEHSATTSGSEESESSATTDSEESDCTESETSDSSGTDDDETDTSRSEERLVVPPQKYFVSYPTDYYYSVMGIRNKVQPQSGHHSKSFGSETFPSGCRVVNGSVAGVRENPYRLVRHSFYSKTVWSYINGHENSGMKNSNIPLTTAVGDLVSEMNDPNQSIKLSPNIKTEADEKVDASFMKSTNERKNENASTNVEITADVHPTAHLTEVDVHPTAHLTEVDVHPTAHLTEVDVHPTAHLTEANVHPTAHLTEVDVRATAHLTEADVHPTITEETAATNVQISDIALEGCVADIPAKTCKELENIELKQHLVKNTKKFSRSRNNEAASLNAVPIEFLYQCTRR